MMGVIVRQAKTEDIGAIVVLCKAHAAYEDTAYDTANKALKLEKYLFGPSKVVECIVAEENGTLVGYATFMPQFSTWDAGFYLYLDCLYLDIAVRGKGIGRIMMDKVSSYAQENGCIGVQWQTPVVNKEAIRFYEHLGAVSKGKARFFWEVGGR